MAKREQRKQHASCGKEFHLFCRYFTDARIGRLALLPAGKTRKSFEGFRAISGRLELRKRKILTHQRP